MNEYKDFKDNLDLVFKIKYKGDEIMPVKIFNIEKESETAYLFMIENTYGTNKEQYELYVKGVEFESNFSIVDSDKQTITLKAAL